jgi:hypothetical protein
MGPHSRTPAPRIAIAAVAALVAASLVAAGCSSDEEGTPEACLVSSNEYRSALQTAPEEVRLDGTAISDCLIPSQDGGELARVGEEMLIAATQLNGEARQDQNGPAAVQLGYLIGAVTAGADNIHADLVRRLNSAANFSPDEAQGARFQRDFGRGFAAGQESG